MTSNAAADEIQQIIKAERANQKDDVSVEEEKEKMVITEGDYTKQSRIIEL